MPQAPAVERSFTSVQIVYTHTHSHPRARAHARNSVTHAHNSLTHSFYSSLQCTRSFALDIFDQSLFQRLLRLSRLSYFIFITTYLYQLLCLHFSRLSRTLPTYLYHMHLYPPINSSLRTCLHQRSSINSSLPTYLHQCSSINFSPSTVAPRLSRRGTSCLFRLPL